MLVKAKLNNLRTSAKKVRLVADLVRGEKTDKAVDLLNFSRKQAAGPVIKLIHSAVANAENNFELAKDNLFIKEIFVNEGVTMKRWMPKAHGRATPIRKRSCHINLVLGELVDSGRKEAKKLKIEEPVRIGGLPKGEGSVKVKEEAETEAKDTEEKGKKSEATHGAEGRHGHAKLEGGHKKGFVNKLFQRKSG